MNYDRPNYLGQVCGGIEGVKLVPLPLLGPRVNPGLLPPLGSFLEPGIFPG